MKGYLLLGLGPDEFLDAVGLAAVGRKALAAQNV